MRRIACVDVGSDKLRLTIAEVDGQRPRVLETLQRSVSLGRDCYADGVIHLGAIRETLEVLTGYQQVLEEYRVRETRAVATSALREAVNREWVLDQIRMNAGVNVEVLSNAEERQLTFLALTGMPGYEAMREDGLLLIDVGYGSTEIAEMRGGELVSSHNVRLGALRLWELIASVADENPRYPELLEELIISNLVHLRELFRWKDIRHCVALSGEAESLLALAGGSITRKRFDALYVGMKRMTPAQIEREFGLSERRAQILLPTMMVIKAFGDMTGAEKLHISPLSLSDGVLEAMCRGEDAGEDALSMARHLATGQRANMAHAKYVEEAALTLYDALTRLHGLGARERLLLRLAAVTHDMGKRLSTSGHGAQSANILKAAPLIGLSDDEQAVVRYLAARHSTRDVLQSASDEAPPPMRLAAMKLLAILKLADALDKSQRQKLTLEGVALENAVLTLTASASRDAQLEKWVFSQPASLFLEVFGVTARLKIRQA